MDEFRDSLQQAPEIPSYRSNRALQHIDQLPYIMHAWVPEVRLKFLLSHLERRKRKDFNPGISVSGLWT